MKLGPGTYYVTRDSDAEGDLCTFCDVWTERPVRFAAGDGFCWLSAEWSLETRVGQASAEAVRSSIGTAPDTDRECVKFLR